MIARGRCEAKAARTGKRCRLSACWRIPFSTRESVEAAVRTGWPMMLPGMIQPDTAGERLLCRTHGPTYLDHPDRIRWSRGKAIANAVPSEEARAEQQTRLREWQATLPRETSSAGNSRGAS